VKTKAGGNTLKEICPTCGKRIAPNRRPGSLTSYLFGAFDCSCTGAGAAPQPQPFSDSAADRDDSDFCPKCGLMIAAPSEDGSLTGFLFQDTRCKCPPDQAFAHGRMSDRFWKMKKAGAGTTFISSSEEAGKSKAMSIDLLPGATIGGAYKIIKLIGHGGMGEVYLAMHETLGKQCALKVIPPEQVTEIGWQRFQLEAKAVAKLEHINLVRVTDLGIHDGCLPFYAMDYVEGENLADLVSEYGPLPLAAFLDIFIQVCDGVDCAHRSGILHRDLKPANIMVLPAKNAKRLAKVLDFGLAKLTGHDRTKQSLTAVGDIFGSPYYMSPEQCSGDKLDRRSDIYSLGCTMFECLTGRPPFSGNLAKSIMVGHLEADPPSLESIVGHGKLPPSMEIVIAKLLRKNPVERYQTLLELRSDLEKVARGEEVQPFYISRGQQRQEGAGATESANVRTKLSDSFPKNLVLLGGVIVAVVTLVVVAGLNKLTSVHPSASIKAVPLATTSLRTGSDSARQFVSASINKAGQASIKDNTPYSTITEENGKQMRVFHFPVDATIGYFTTTIREVLPAVGVVRSPATDRLVFTPYPCALKNPEYLKRFRPGDIYAILISTRRGYSDFIKDLAPDDEAGNTKYEVNDYLTASSVVPGVESVKLVVYADYSPDIDLTLLDKFPALKDLYISDTRLNAKQLSKLSILKQLERLELAQNNDIDVTPILKSLKNSTHMKTLFLPWSDTSLEGVTCAASLPQLEYLFMGAVNPNTPECTVKFLNVLRKAPKLEHLWIESLPMTADALTALKSFPRLKTLRCNQEKSGIDNKDRVQITNAAAHMGLTSLKFDWTGIPQKRKPVD